MQLHVKFKFFFFYINFVQNVQQNNCSIVNKSNRDLADNQSLWTIEKKNMQMHGNPSPNND